MTSTTNKPEFTELAGAIEHLNGLMLQAYDLAMKADEREPGAVWKLRCLLYAATDVTVLMQRRLEDELSSLTAKPNTPKEA